MFPTCKLSAVGSNPMYTAGMSPLDRPLLATARRAPSQASLAPCACSCSNTGATASHHAGNRDFSDATNASSACVVAATKPRRRSRAKGPASELAMAVAVGGGGASSHSPLYFMSHIYVICGRCTLASCRCRTFALSTNHNGSSMVGKDVGSLVRWRRAKESPLLTLFAVLFPAGS